MWSLLLTLQSLIAPGDVAIVHDREGFPLPSCEACQRIDALAPRSPARPVRAIIATGHGEHGRVLGRVPDDFAAVVHGIAPDLEWLVLDTCYGAQTEVLLALEAAGVRARIVAFADWLPSSGLDYGAALTPAGFDPTAVECCGAVRRAPTFVDPGAGAMVRALEATALDEGRRCALRRPLVHVLPNLYPIAPEAAAGPVRGPVLVHLSAESWPEGCDPPEAP